LVIVGYHGGTSIPLANLADSAWQRFYAWYPYPKPLSIDLGFGRKDLGPVMSRRSLVSATGDTLSGDVLWTWIDGRRMPFYHDSLLVDKSIARVDSILATPPDAFVDLDVTREAGRIDVAIAVDSLRGSHQSVALRIVLFEDSVRVRGGTKRRVHLNVARSIARSEQYPLGLPISATEPSRSTYRFDLDEIQRQLERVRDPRTFHEFTFGRDHEFDPRDSISLAGEYLGQFPDSRDWKMNTARLYVLAFVQDLETGEVLQGSFVRVPRQGSVKSAR
jgi:hypothetical protein